MEAKAFSLLKYWRGGRGRSISLGDGEFAATSAVGTTTVDRAARQHFAVSDSGSDAEDDGPFFDLRFNAVTEYDEDGENEDMYGDVQLSETDGGSGSGEPDSESDGGLKLAFSPSSASNVDGNSSLSPPDGIVTVSEVNSKFPVSLLKSATKLRVLMLKLNRAKQKDEKLERNPRQKTQIRGEKMFLRVKLKVEEVKIRSLFKRDSSSNSNADESSSGSSEERKSSKEMIRKYLKLVRSSGNLSFFGGVTTAAACNLPPQSTAENLETEPTECSEKAAVLRNARSQKRVVPQTLVKSRSASSTAAGAAPVSSKRLDDSLKEQNDGIQGAILHCKRSLNA